MSSATTRKDMVSAVLEGIAHRVADVVESMSVDAGKRLELLRVDGGLTNIASLMQFQVDVLGIPVEVLADHDATALGAAYMAGAHLGLMSVYQLSSGNHTASRFEPQRDEAWRHGIRSKWKCVIRHVQDLSKQL